MSCSGEHPHDTDNKTGRDLSRPSVSKADWQVAVSATT